LTVRELVDVLDVPLGVLAFPVSVVLKLRFAETGNGPAAETDELEQS